MSKCTVCGIVLPEKKKLYCSRGCRNKAIAQRQKKVREKFLSAQIIDNGGECINCGHDKEKSLFFLHPTLSRAEIGDILLVPNSARALKAISESKLICRNCYWEEK